MIKKISLKIKPCKKNIGAELICNLNKIHKNQIKLIKNSLNEYGLIFFRNQSLNPTNYIKFAKKFGKLAKYPRLKGLSKKYPQITVVQRKATDKGPSFGEQFHTDSSYTKKPPKFTMLLSKQVPKLGLANTEFSSQYLAYKDLHSKYKKKLSSKKPTFLNSERFKNTANPFTLLTTIGVELLFSFHSALVCIYGAIIAKSGI